MGFWLSLPARANHFTVLKILTDKLSSNYQGFGCDDQGSYTTDPKYTLSFQIMMELSDKLV